jgi:hypothetical protein
VFHGQLPDDHVVHLESESGKPLGCLPKPGEEGVLVRKRMNS